MVGLNYLETAIIASPSLSYSPPMAFSRPDCSGVAILNDTRTVLFGDRGQVDRFSVYRTV